MGKEEATAAPILSGLTKCTQSQCKCSTMHDAKVALLFMVFASNKELFHGNFLVPQIKLSSTVMKAILGCRHPATIIWALFEANFNVNGGDRAVSFPSNVNES